MNKITKAKYRIDGFLDDLGRPVRVYVHDDEKLYIEFSSGMSFSLSEEEINYQAEEFDAENNLQYQVIWLNTHYAPKTEIYGYHDFEENGFYEHDMELIDELLVGTVAILVGGGILVYRLANK